MSDPILSLLQHPDPAQRQRGIKAAAKSRDRRYLQPLAQIVRNETDQNIRELAKRAGTYIHKQTQAAAATPTPPPPAAVDGLPIVEALLESEREANPEQAQIHYDQAFELHLKGQDARAVLELGSAFYLNPAYAQDRTAVAFAAEMTGKPPAEAVRYIANPDNWQELTNQYGGFQKTETERTETQTLYLWIAGAIALVLVTGLVIAAIQTDVFGEVLQASFSGLTGGATGGAVPIPTPSPTPTPQ
jgi:hypothetical protein